MKVDHADKQIFPSNPKATSLALFAGVCFLRFSSPRVEGFFICRVHFKSHVKPLVKVRAFIQPREDMKIKTVQQPMRVWHSGTENSAPPPPPSPPHIHILQLNAGEITICFFHNMDLMRALSFLLKAVCSQCWKIHAQLMKSKASVGITSEESGKELFSR